jgi:hypothetical protein
MVQPVATVLPTLLVVAAVGSQFSAAVADNSGAGGLVRELSHHKLKPRLVYGLILVVTLALTWGTHVNEIISYASRAFALFYALQCAVAAYVAHQKQGLGAWRAPLYALLALFCVAVFALGLPAEG